MQVPHELTPYGIWVNDQGALSDENWEKCNNTFDRLERRIPPHGISVFGRMNVIYTYYLCMFNYVLNIIAPSDAMVKHIYKVVTRFVWYPSKAHCVRRNVLILPVKNGGIGFPDIFLRKSAARLMLLIRFMFYKEVLSWRRSFDHFYRKVEHKTRREIKNIFVDDIFKDIRRAVIDSSFRRDGDFIWLFGRKFHNKNMTATFIYRNRFLLNITMK